MQRWGVVVTAFYLLLVIGLILPLGQYLADLGTAGLPLALFNLDILAGGAWVAWIGLGLLATAQALLLFLSVDTSWKRLRPRQHIFVSVAATTFAAGLLCVAVLIPVFAAARLNAPFDTGSRVAVALIAIWGAWAVIFYLYRQRVSERLDRTVSWLLNGSVLQLLIAVPCHIIVRQRGDCSAPIATSFGISTGIAVMLMAFGPSVVFLYQKRLREYGGADAALSVAHRWPARKVLAALTLAAVALFVLLPLDSEWFLGLALPADELPAMETAVAEVTQRLGITSPRGENDAFELRCGSGRVARATVRPLGSDSSETWNIWIRADQRELFAALRALAEQHASDWWVTNDPPQYEQWRARMVGGAFFGRGCRAR